MAANAARVTRVQPEMDRVLLEPSPEFVATPEIDSLTDRALTYLSIGKAVHFAGPAGTGKTTLAFHVAARLGRPVMLIHGDDEFASSDLVGKDSGFRRSKVIDNFIHSVLRTEENVNSVWVDNRLTTACQNGYTLIYDEFTRSRPEANNPLLSVLEEGILNLPGLRRAGEGYLEVHPQFRAIFTSNPEEYAGVHRTQDALLDRMITIPIGHLDRTTEIAVVMGKSGISEEDSTVVVDVVRTLRAASDAHHRPSVRASITIARILSARGSQAHPDDITFRWACRDVLGALLAKATNDSTGTSLGVIDEMVNKVWAHTRSRSRQFAAKEVQ